MTESKLKKYLERRTEAPKGALVRRPIIYSDSKGRYLQEHCYNEAVGESIEWNIHSGKGSEYLVQEIKKDLETSENVNKQIYLWAGTCDLTIKRGKYIYIKDDTTSAQSRLVNNLLRAEELVLDYSKARLTVLQIPYYSLREWNERKGHPNPNDFRNSDRRLKQLVDVANSVVDSINTRTGSRSPKFNVDLEKARKNRGQPTEKYVNWALFKDGIHPDNLLSRVWLRSICKEVVKTCY